MMSRLSPRFGSGRRPGGFPGCQAHKVQVASTRLGGHAGVRERSRRCGMIGFIWVDCFLMFFFGGGTFLFPAWLCVCFFFSGPVSILSISISIYVYNYIYIYIYIYLSTISIYRSIDLSIDRSTDLSIYRSIELSIIELSSYRSIDLSICRSMDLSIYLI